MNNESGQRTPLIDSLRSVPVTFRAEWETMWTEGGTCIGHAMAPLGRYAHEAADRIEELERAALRVIGEHNAPHDCYATGPMTGDDHKDLVECPSCAFLALMQKGESK